MTSSGASSFAKASLKEKAKATKADAQGTDTIQGTPLKPRMSLTPTVTYVSMTKDHRSWGFGAMKSLTTSGSPANFCPVWFHPRIRRIVVNTITVPGICTRYALRLLGHD